MKKVTNNLIKGEVYNDAPSGMVQSFCEYIDLTAEGFVFWRLRPSTRKRWYKIVLTEDYVFQHLKYIN